ncbi:MAG: serine/threonine-protein kinase [Gemmatimonadaceae bacterium]|nr:serine/threonine-protein kinase [Gemmatimonadaceae bacterium]
MTAPLPRLAAALADRYRIERELGAGGMATVFLAADLKHDRKVAIKVLKPELAAVLGADRFVVEIKTTAAMSHPHILPLFDSGTADGFLYYVMPYIEGETIREKLNRETQFGIDEAVRITREIADALDYAHRRGIIHRDIKPENILLHDGRAMVMDFGIALAVSAAAGGRMTETGLSLGTPHYMSPEQATAEKEITPRSDVYSLASVLYEMLAGEPPHSGGSAQAIIMKIIAESAQPVTQLRKSVPAHVAAALAVALQKVPADRFESAAKFGEALANPAFTTQGTALMPGATGRARGVTMPVFASTAAVALVASAWALWSWQQPARATDDAQSVQFEIPLPDSIRVTSVAVSPDDRQIVIGAGANGRQALLSRLIDDVELREIAGTNGGRSPFFSPDGAWIAFFTSDELRKVPRQGGVSQRIASLGALGTGSSGSWGPDGSIVVSRSFNRGGLVRVDAAGGALVPFTGKDSTERGSWHFRPRFLSDGRSVVFGIATARRGAGEIGIATLDGKTTRQVTALRALTPWRHDSLLTLSGERGLAFATLTGNPRTLSEPGPTIVDDVLVSLQGSAIYDLSARGTLAYVRGSSDRRLVAVSRTGVATPLFATSRLFRRPVPSPDGSRIAVELRSESGMDAAEIWILDRRAATLQRLTFGGGQDPIWTSDGRRIVFTRSDTLGGYNLYWQPADGSGAAERLLLRDGSQHALAVTPDGSGIIFDDVPLLGNTDIWFLPLTGDRTPRPILATEFTERLPTLSPDGKWMAYASNESGRVEVYVRPFPGPGAKVQVSVDGGNEPTWSGSGRELYYRDATSMVAATVEPGASFRVTGRAPLFADPYYRGTSLDYHALPGGGFAMLQPSSASQLLVITNWVRAVGRLGKQ